MNIPARQSMNMRVRAQHAQTTIGSSETPEAHGDGSSQSGDKPLSTTPDFPAQPSPYSGTNSTSIGGSTQATELYHNIQMHVLLSVPLGSEIALKHIDITDFNDEKFFRSLQLAYLGAKGLSRRLLGVWQYSHCNFYKFEKFYEGEIAPRGPGIRLPTTKSTNTTPNQSKTCPQSPNTSSETASTPAMAAASLPSSASVIPSTAAESPVATHLRRSIVLPSGFGRWKWGEMRGRLSGGCMWLRISLSYVLLSFMQWSSYLRLFSGFCGCSIGTILVICRMHLCHFFVRWGLLACSGIRFMVGRLGWVRSEEWM